MPVVTGDTKVVERGKADGIFITTSGIGAVQAPTPIHPTAIRPGDQLLLSGDLGRHGVAILAARHGLALVPHVLSDCAPLWISRRAWTCSVRSAAPWPICMSGGSSTAT